MLVRFSLLISCQMGIVDTSPLLFLPSVRVSEIEPPDRKRGGWEEDRGEVFWATLNSTNVVSTKGWVRQGDNTAVFGKKCEVFCDWSMQCRFPNAVPSRSGPTVPIPECRSPGFSGCVCFRWSETFPALAGLFALFESGLFMNLFVCQPFNVAILSSCPVFLFLCRYFSHFN